MRIISGKHGGRILKEFKGCAVRPTSDRAREALFNILGNVSGLTFLDLFSGTGAIGLESLSRGADPVTMVDVSRESVEIIKSNLSVLKESAEVVNEDAFSFVKRTNKKFDIIFLDPPYNVDAQEVIKTVAERKLLNEGGLLIYERAAENKCEFTCLKLTDSRKYGIAAFDFYTY